MKFLALPKIFSDALQGITKKISEDKDRAVIVGVEEEAFVVLSWERYHELLAKENSPTVVKEYIPYRPYWTYWSTQWINGHTISTTPVNTLYSTIHPSVTVGGTNSSMIPRNVMVNGSMTILPTATATTAINVPTWIDNVTV